MQLIIAATPEVATRYETMFKQILGSVPEKQVAVQSGAEVAVYSANTYSPAYWQAMVAIVDRGYDPAQIDDNLSVALELLYCATPTPQSSASATPARIRTEKKKKETLAVAANTTSETQQAAPYGLRKDGTPRAKPGRKAGS